MTDSRAVSCALLLSSLLAAGCATMTVGQRFAGASQDHALLDLCVFTPGSGMLDRNAAHLTMNDAVGSPMVGMMRAAASRQRDASGAVTVKSLHAYLSPKVQDAAKRANRDQVPQLIAGDGDRRLR